MQPQEQLHFERPELWSEEFWQAREPDRLRAKQVLEHLMPYAVTILDVGCGNGVLFRQAGETRTITGADRSFTALLHGDGDRCQADATELPFARGSFDAVVCMEMLEHLSHEAYPAALGELARVARKQIILTVPYQENLPLSHVICPVCACNFHPYHHVRSFAIGDLQTLFPRQAGVTFQEAYGIQETDAPGFPWAWNLIRRIYHRRAVNFPWYATCPQCGFAGQSPARSPQQHSPPRLRGRDIWPKRKTFTWWLAIYRRD